MEPIQRQPLAKWNPNRDCWEEPQEDIFGHSGVWSETWPPSGMTRNGLVFELPMSARRTAGTGSFLLLSTPDTVPEAPNSGTNANRIMGLGNQVKALPTPRATDGHGHGHHGTGGPDLRTVAVELLLPTPAAMNPNDGESVETWEARRARVKVTANNGNGFGTPLAIAVQKLLPTPTTQDGANTGGGITVQPEQPSVEHSGADTWGDYRPAIERWETVLGRTAPPPTLPDGKNGNHRLNSAFVEWMMGLPEGHVTNSEIGLTRNEQLKALGNGVVPAQAMYALRLLLETP